VSFAGNSYWLPSATAVTVGVTGITTPLPGAGAAQTISFANIANREYGPAAALNATATSGLPVTYTTTTPQNCSILSLGNGAYSVQSAPGVGGNSVLCSVVASQAGDTRYASATPVTRSFYWNKAAMAVSITNGVTTRTGVGPFQLIASVRYVTTALNSNLASLGEPLTVTSLTPAICTVSAPSLLETSTGIFNQATVTGVKSGVCSTVWAYTGSDTRAAASVQHTFTLTGIK
jgi:hypothetical protein